MCVYNYDYLYCDTECKCDAIMKKKLPLKHSAPNKNVLILLVVKKFDRILMSKVVPGKR